MIYDATSPADCTKAIEALKGFFAKGKKFEMKAKHSRRSISQNSYLHLILTWFSIETGYTLEEVKQDIFKKHVNANLFYEGEFGSKIKIERWRSTASLDTAEMSLAIDRFRNFASAECGIYLPEPKDLVIIQEMEIEISKRKNQEFI